MYKALVIITTLLSFNVSATLGTKDRPVILAKNNWTSQIVLSHILQEIYLRYGIHSELKPMSEPKQWPKISRGWIHVQVEVWQGTMEDKFLKYTKMGTMIDMGDHNAKTREEWWYPLYVEKLCPGLPDWKALKNCSHVFNTPLSKGKGVYISGPWEKPELQRIKALGLNFIVDRVNKADDLWVRLERAKSRNQAILLFNWTPNWVEAKHKGRFVEFPKFEKACETQKEWGINIERKYDCGNPKDGWLKKVAWKGLSENKCAYDILKNMSFTNEQIAKVSHYVDGKNMSHAEASLKWISENKRIWNKWITKSCVKN